MSLSELHAEHLANLTGEAQVDYLLNCLDYLVADDVSGWKMRFARERTSTEIKQQKESTSQPKKKKRRMSPDVVVEEKLDRCRSCQSLDVVDDMMAGSVVCTACGLIQESQLLGVGVANMSFEQLMHGNRKTVHHYSRVVYFRSFLMGIQGKTTPSVTQAELESLRLICVGSAVDSRSIDESKVVFALKKLCLSTRLRRHRYSLLCMLNPLHVPVQMDAKTFFLLLRCFRVVECHWQHGLKRKLGDRKVFFSYPYVFYQLCVHLDLMHLTGDHHLVRNIAALDKLHYAYGCIAKKAGFRFNVDIHRD